jgi:hypothetical protein
MVITTVTTATATATTTTTTTKRGIGSQLQLISEPVASDTGGGLAKLPLKESGRALWTIPSVPQSVRVK